MEIIRQLKSRENLSEIYKYVSCVQIPCNYAVAFSLQTEHKSDLGTTNMQHKMPVVTKDVMEQPNTQAQAVILRVLIRIDHRRISNRTDISGKFDTNLACLN
jgi:hypothetical protein